MQNYNTIEEKSSEWNVSIRYLQYLCRQEKIEGASKRAGVWFIPKDASIPMKNTKKGGPDKKNFTFVGTKNKIFRTAIEMFLLHGSDNVSFKSIADKVGIRQASVYNHFKSKQELLDTIYDYYCYHYLGEGTHLEDFQESISEKSPEEILGCVRYEFQEEHRQTMIDITGIILQRIGTDERARKIATSLIANGGINYVESILDNSVKAGKFAPFDTHAMAVFINAIRIFMLYSWITEPTPDNRAKLLEDEVALYRYASRFLTDLKQCNK